MTRVKPQIEVYTISNQEEADEALRELCELNRELDLINLDAQEKIDAIKTTAQNQSLPINQRVEVLGMALNTYATANKKELFAKTKTNTLCFGSFGFRLSSKLKTLSKVKWENVLQNLKDKNLTDFIRIKEEVDKDKLKSQTNEFLKDVGCQVVQDDTFFYELNRDEYNKIGSNNG